MNINSTDELTILFIKACEASQWQEVVSIMNTFVFMKYKEKQSLLDSNFVKACKYNRLSVVKGLLTSDEIPLHPDIHYLSDNGLINAGYEGHEEIIDYLLFSPELKHHANVTSQNHCLIESLCWHGKLNMIQKLLSLPEYTDKRLLDKNAMKSLEINGIVTAHNKGHTALLEYFIFERRSFSTEAFIKTLKEFDIPLEPDLLNYFMKRDLNDKLLKQIKDKNHSEIKITKSKI